MDKSNDFVYPSGGHYPETKEDYVDHLLILLSVADEQQLNNFAVETRKRGGKFAALVDLIQGIITMEQFEILAKNNGWTSSDSNDE